MNCIYRSVQRCYAIQSHLFLITSDLFDNMLRAFDLCRDLFSVVLLNSKLRLKLRDCGK